MLVLTRKADQKIHLGSNIIITVLKIKGGAVRIGVEAPSEVRVMRAELTPKAVASGERLTVDQTDAEKTQAASPLGRRVAEAASCDNVPSDNRVPSASNFTSADNVTSPNPASEFLARPSAGSPRRRVTSNAANASDARTHGRGPASAADGFSSQSRPNEARERYAMNFTGPRLAGAQS